MDYHLTSDQIRAVIRALIEQAKVDGRGYGTPLCRFGIPEEDAGGQISRAFCPQAVMLVTFPWQPQWSPPSQYVDNDMPIEIRKAIKDLPVDIGAQGWIVSYFPDQNKN